MVDGEWAPLNACVTQNGQMDKRNVFNVHFDIACARFFVCVGCDVVAVCCVVAV